MARTRHIVACVLLAGGLALCAAAVEAVGTGDGIAGIQEALEHLQQGRYVEAESQALAAADHPRSPSSRAWAVVAAARQRRGDLAGAERAYRVLLSASDCPELQQFASGQIQACQRSAARPAAPAAPSKRLSRNELARLAEVRDGQYAESSDHFIVRARNPHVARLLAAEAEVALDRICRVILAGQDYPHSVTVNVWPDRDSYRAHAADAPEWSGGCFRRSSSDGIVTRQIDLTQRDEQGRFATLMLDRVLPHELCHLVLTERFGDSPCPLVLNEGLAMMAESEVDAGRAVLAGKTVAGKGRIHLAGLFVAQRYDMPEPAAFYAESFSFIEFLHGRVSPEQFRAFLDHLKGGATIADALQRSLYVPASDGFIPALAEAWEDHAIEQAQYLQALARADHKPGAADGE